MIVLLTPTGGRPRQFELCQKWMAAQTYKGRVLWIVVDDCLPRTSEIKEAFPDTWTIVHKYPFPVWRLGGNTQSRNLREGLRVIKALPQEDIEGIFIIEDDDYYRPQYLEKMRALLPGYEAVGEMCTVYYNVTTRRWKKHQNTRHSSLFQTAFVLSALKVFEESLDFKFIDIAFFKRLNCVYLFDNENLSIGIKGMPGRAGIGKGHQNTGPGNDPDCTTLQNLIGEDVRWYR